MSVARFFLFIIMFYFNFVCSGVFVGKFFDMFTDFNFEFLCPDIGFLLAVCTLQYAYSFSLL